MKRTKATCHDMYVVSAPFAKTLKKPSVQILLLFVEILILFLKNKCVACMSKVVNGRLAQSTNKWIIISRTFSNLYRDGIQWN